MARVTDFRIQVGFFDHYKTRMLESRVGAEGVVSLLRLWEYTSQYRPEGILYDMDHRKIEAVSSWKGEQGLFFEALRECGFLDHATHEYVENLAALAKTREPHRCLVDCVKNSETFAIHDWAEHNPWAFGTAQRSEKARKAAGQRWSESTPECPPHASSNASSNALEHASSNALEHASSNAPYPSHNRTHNQESLKASEKDKRNNRSKAKESGNSSHDIKIPTSDGQTFTVLPEKVKELASRSGNTEHEVRSRIEREASIMEKNTGMRKPSCEIEGFVDSLFSRQDAACSAPF